MQLLAFGINHKTAPVEIRERVAFAPTHIGDALRDLAARDSVNEAAILSTCNRTELYCCVDNEAANIVVEDWFTQYHSLTPDDVKPYIYLYPDQQAVRHLLRVASGLDSLVLGEPQILGQVKTAYRQAEEAGSLGAVLHRLCQHTFNVAKQVRTDTAIGASAVSVAFAAVSLAKQIFSTFPKRTALLIGAGETIELTARHLHENNIGHMIIANRTQERAEQLAKEFNATAIFLGDLPKYLDQADIVISSTASQLPILGKGSVERAIKARKHRPMLMVDIAVPRDIEPEVAQLSDIYLYTVDDLQEIIEEGLKTRRAAADQAEEIIDLQVSHFMGWVQSQTAVSVIRDFRSYIDQIRQTELAKAQKMLAAGKNTPDEVLERFARNLSNKLAHLPTQQIRYAGTKGQHKTLALIREIFDLKDDH